MSSRKQIPALMSVTLPPFPGPAYPRDAQSLGGRPTWTTHSATRSTRNYPRHQPSHQPATTSSRDRSRSHQSTRRTPGQPSGPTTARPPNRSTTHRPPNPATVDHLSKHLDIGLKLIHHLNQIGATRETSRLPKSFSQMARTIMRNLKPAQPSAQLQKTLQQTTNQFFHNINEDMRAHYKTILAKTSEEISRLAPSNTALQKSSQVALTWERSKNNRKIQPATVHTFRTWVRTVQGCTEPDSITQLMTSNPAQKPTQKPTQQPTQKPTQRPARPARPPPIPTSNRFQALEDESTFQETVNNTSIPLADQLTAGPSTPQKQPPAPQKPISSLYDKDLPSVNAQGPADPLSNFYMATLTFRGENFQSSEHAYQTIKAMFMDCPSLAQDIMMAKTASKAKELAKCLDDHPKTPIWDQEKEMLMTDILWAKAQQVPIFREKLQKTGRKRITHKIPDEFWGTTCTNAKGKTIVGKDKFPYLLMLLREKIQPLPPRPQPTPRKKNNSRPATYAEAVQIQPPTPGKRNRQPQSSPPTTPAKKQRTRTPPRRSPSPQPEPQTQEPTTRSPRSPTPPPRTPPPRVPRSSHQISPSSDGRASPTETISDHPLTQLLNEMETRSIDNSDDEDCQSEDISESALHQRIAEETPREDQPTSTTVNQMIDYFTNMNQPTTHIANATGSLFQILRPDEVPKFERAVLILGDSNVKHIQEAPKNLPVQIISFPGATISSFHRNVLKRAEPSDVPKVVILSIGINNTADMQPTHCSKEIDRLLSRAQKQFPDATIYIPKLNYTKVHDS